MVDVLEIKGAIFSVNEPFFDWALNIGSLSNSTVKARLSTWGMKRTHPALRATPQHEGNKENSPRPTGTPQHEGNKENSPRHASRATPLHEGNEENSPRPACHPPA